MGRIGSTIHGLKPAMMMVVVQVALAGVNIVYKLAPTIGMSLRVLIAYRFLVAAAFMIPLALVIERKRRPKLTWVVVFQAFLCGLFGGSLAQNLYAECLVLTSATFAAAMTNLIPAITFILAVSFGLERLGLGTLAGKAKVVGTLMCIGGAMLLTFYKGAVIKIWSTTVNILHHGGGHVATSHHAAGNPVLGALLVVGCCFSTAGGFIIQAKMMRNFPCPYSSTAMMISFGGIQAAVFAFCMERDWSQWKLGWNLRLLLVSYAGIVASGITFTLMAWCVQMRGPLFVSVFNPLMLLFVAIAGSLLLDEKIHLGTVLGAVVIVCGLYAVLWGKGKELKRITQLIPSKSLRESERIDIIVTSSAENNNNSDSGGNNNMVVLIPNDVSMAYPLNEGVSRKIMADDEGEDGDGDIGEGKGKGESSEINGNV